MNRASKKFLMPTIALLTFAVAVALWLFLLYQGGANRLRTLDTSVALTEGDPQRGYNVISTYGCGACHEIPGIPAAHGRIGPSLSGFRDRLMIAGVMPNSSDNLIQWIQHPRIVDPKTAMPDLGLSETDARDVAAYLYSTN
jgi:cytochrome c2